MRRLLPFIVSLAVAIATLAQPSFSCVSGTTALGIPAHTCCSDEGITTAPAPVCCVVSQPVGDRTATASRSVDTRPAAADRTLPIRFRVPQREPVRRRAGPPSVCAAAPVPFYLQQRALLI